ncbi:MAG: type IV pilus assembly protein PilC [Candidatus Binatia bacterium]|jgi:type IV pilus assembly protein PilC
MPVYSYLARDGASGRETRKEIEAATEDAATAVLLNKNYIVLEIKEKVGQKKRAGGTIKLDDIVVFTRQLSTMIDAGLAVVESLRALGDQTTNKAMQDVIRDVTSRVEQGDNFSDALRKHPKAFDRLYTSMVDAGEKGGLLAEILARVATFLESRQRMNKKIKSALMYPTMVSTVAVLITIFLMVKVVPVFAEVFSGFGGALPKPTQYLINVSDFIKTYFLFIMFGGGGMIYSWFWYTKTPKGMAFWDHIRIRLPIFGHIAHKIILARFTRTFAALIRAGVPILDVLNIVANTAGHTQMEACIRLASSDIEKGDGISAALSKHEIFPVMIIRMMTAGEQTGNIDNMMEKVADFLDEEIETILNGLTSLIEPLLIVFLGVTVGTIVVCMFLPIFKMGELVSS